MTKARSGGKDSVGRETHATTEERRRRIAEAAYFRALQRGFNGGDPVDDWLAAEREIGQAPPGAQQQTEGKAASTKGSARQ